MTAGWHTGDVPLGTNHLERVLLPIPIGRKNWLFCWTEIGAEHIGIIQSLISTCKLHDVNPTSIWPTCCYALANTRPAALMN